MCEPVQLHQGVMACINTTWGLLPVSVEILGPYLYQGGAGWRWYVGAGAQLPRRVLVIGPTFGAGEHVPQALPPTPTEAQQDPANRGHDTPVTSDDGRSRTVRDGWQSCRTY